VLITLIGGRGVACRGSGRVVVDVATLDNLAKEVEARSAALELIVLNTANSGDQLRILKMQLVYLSRWAAIIKKAIK
jgi:hypothetical protein